MRVIVCLAICVGLLMAAGIIHFRKSGDRVDVSIDTGELRDKTEEIIDAVKDTLSDEEREEGVSGRFDEMFDDARDAIDSAEEAGADLFEHTRPSRRDR